jgi:glycolate oxidase FAD binding subunit
VTVSSLTIDGVTPGSVVSPASAEELASALKAANEAGRAVTAVGGGTQLNLGMPPARLDVAIETTRLSRVVEYEPADLTVTVEAGMRFGELQRILGEQGQFLALDPPMADGATIGGVIATNASGPLRFAFGTARDLVIGTRVANPGGTLTHAGGRVVKNVAGYDLNKLYIGSLGTLAIVVELSFKLAPIPPATATVVGELNGPDQARSVVGDFVRSPLAPLAVELVGLPPLPDSGGLRAYRLVVRLGGYPEAVWRQERDVSALLAQHGATRADVPAGIWENLARMRVDAHRRAVVVKAAAPISSAASLVEIFERHFADLEPFVWAHAGNGVAYAACNAPASAEPLAAARAEVQGLGGNASLVIERCPVEIKRAIDVWGDPGPSVALMRALKAKLDPNNTLNPGRYVGGI